MSLIVETDSGTGANLTSEIALGEYSATRDMMIGTSGRLSSLNGAAATITVVLRHMTSGGATIREFRFSESKRTATDTVYGWEFLPFLVKAGERIAHRVISTNSSDTNAAWAIDYLNLTPTSIEDVARVVNRSRTIFVATSGNDANDGLTPPTAKLTIGAALAIAAAGDTVQLIPGLYDLGSGTVSLPDDVSLLGAGEALTRITSSADALVHGAVIHPGDRSRVADLRITCTAPSGWTAGVGCVVSESGANQAPCVDALVERVIIDGDSDGVLIQDDQGATTPGSIVIRDSIVNTKYDCLACFNASPSSTPNTYRITADRCRLSALGPSATNVGKTHVAWADTGTITLIDCWGEARDGGDEETFGLLVGTARGVIRAQRTSLRVSASMGTVRSLSNADGVLEVCECSYDPIQTSGTITQIDTPGNVTGKVLGVGSATITGTGVRADDRDGDAVAKAADLATVDGVADAINTKLGTPAGASIAADIAEIEAGQLDAAGVWTYGTRTLTGGTATAISPVDSEDNLALYVPQDFSATTGLTVSWSKSGYPAAEWESGAEGAFRYRVYGGQTATGGTVTLSHDGSTTLSATLDLTYDEASGLTGPGFYEVEITSAGGLKRILAHGRLTVSDDVPN